MTSGLVEPSGRGATMLHHGEKRARGKEKQRGSVLELASTKCKRP
jgi:hypothetical protein